MLGLGRPRLKSRPSLLTLIRPELERAPTPAPPPELPPLPDSPAPSISTTSTSPISSSVTTNPSTMAPAESHEHGAIFSVSGPVVVAEHMIGCAMYELVRPPRSSSHLPSRAVLMSDPLRRHSATSVMTCLLVKLFVLRPIRLQFRSTRKLVRSPTSLGHVTRPDDFCSIGHGSLTIFLDQ